MSDGYVEQGPIRPPSEAFSVLVRVSRNCPWNRCAFCPVYKGESYSRRPVEDVHADIDALAGFHGSAARTVFLQDADPLLTRPDDLLSILARVREKFPEVRRITTYVRSRTLGRRSVDDLARIREAGLTRVHVGLESGCDRVLELVSKGVTSAQQVEGGRKAVAAGLELCFYVMPGLGGRGLSDAHADETAAVVRAVGPHHVRLRTTVPIPGTPLGDLVAGGEFEPLSEEEAVAEIRRLVAGLDGVNARLESDHAMNLLLHLRGGLPGDLERLLGMCDAFLDLPATDRELFILGRRLGGVTHLEQLDRPGVRRELEARREELRAQGLDPAAVCDVLRRRLV